MLRQVQEIDKNEEVVDKREKRWYNIRKSKKSQERKEKY